MQNEYYARVALMSDVMRCERLEAAQQRRHGRRPSSEAEFRFEGNAGQTPPYTYEQQTNAPKIRERLTDSTLIFVGRLWPSFRISRSRVAAEHRPWPPQRLAFAWCIAETIIGLVILQLYFV
jgi:hypothetical protein